MGSWGQVSVPFKFSSIWGREARSVFPLSIVQRGVWGQVSVPFKFSTTTGVGPGQCSL